MIRFLALALSGWWVFGLAAVAAAEVKSVEELAAEARSGVEFVDDDYLLARLADNADLLLVDVRTESEFQAGHIPGARSIPRGVLEFRLAREERDGDREVILYCATGTRAALALKSLQAAGYRNVRAHRGFDGWEEDGGKVSRTEQP